MNIEVRLFANLAQMLPPGSQNKRARMKVENGTTIGGLLNILKINHGITKILMVNGVQTLWTRLKSLPFRGLHNFKLLAQLIDTASMLRKLAQGFQHSSVRKGYT